MANKKVSQLVSKPSVLVTDLFPIADPTTGQLFKTTISDLGTAIGSGVSSVNTLVGAVVLDTDDIQELASPTNRWFTDTRARAAISGGTGISYNSGTGVITNAVTSGQIATALGYTPANGADYLPLAGGTMGGAIFGTIATFASSTSVTALGITLSGATGDGVKITHSAGRAFNIQSSGSGFGILINNETASTSAPFTIQKQGLDRITFTDAGAGSFASSLTANSFVKTSGTSSQFLKADGSVDSTSYQPTLTNPVTGTGTSGIVAKFNGTSTITDSIIYDNGTRVSIGANVTTSNTFTAVASTTSAYAVVAQASGAANGFWAVLSGTGEIFRGQTNGGSYFIVNNGGNAFLNGNLNIGDFGSTSFKLNVIGTANITGALSGTSATFTTGVSATNGYGFTSSLSTESITFSNSWFGGIDAIFQNSGNNNDFGIYLNGGTSTQAKFYITNGGNVGIGTAAPSRRLHIVSGQSSIPDVCVQGADVGQGWIGFGTTNDYGIQAGTDYTAMIFRANNAERMRITSGGAVLINQTSGNAAAAFEVTTLSGQTNTAVFNSTTTTAPQIYLRDAGGAGKAIIQSNSTIAFNNGSSFGETMRIGSDGYTKMSNAGTYYGSTFHEIRSNNTNNALQVSNTNSTPYGIWIHYPNSSVATTNYEFIYTANNTESKFIVWSNGSVINRTGSYGTISDVKFKENIVDATPKLGDLAKLKVRNFNLIGSSEKQIGFIAQEFEEVFPNMIDINTEKGTDGETYKSIKTSVLVPMLVKAIQELNDKVKTLENK
jgi:hypothetical protein